MIKTLLFFFCILSPIQNNSYINNDSNIECKTIDVYQKDSIYYQETFNQNKIYYLTKGSTIGLEFDLSDSDYNALSMLDEKGITAVKDENKYYYKITFDQDLVEASPTFVIENEVVFSAYFTFVDTVDKIDIYHDSLVILKNTDVDFKCYLNGHKTAVPSSANVSWHLENGEHTKDIINQNLLKYNSSDVQFSNFNSEFKISAEYHEDDAIISSNKEEILVNTTKYSSTYELINKRRIYFLNDETGFFDLKVDKDSLPLVSTNSLTAPVSIISSQLIESDEAFDIYRIEVAFIEAFNEQSIVLKGATGQEESILFSIRMGVITNIESLSITGPKGIIQYKSVQSYQATLNGDKDLVSKNIEWYLNDTLISSKGSTITHTYSEGGEVRVRAELGDIVSNQIEFTVRYTSYEMYFWYAIFVIIVIIIIVTLINNKKRKKYSEIQKEIITLKDIISDFNQVHKKIKDGKRTPNSLNKITNIILYTTHASDRLNEKYIDTQLPQYNKCSNYLIASRQSLKKILNKNDKEVIAVESQNFLSNFDKAIKLLENLDSVLKK